MKRFLADVILIMVLVGVGNYLQLEKETDPTSVETKVEEFEKTIAQHEQVKPQTKTVSLQDSKDNHASRLAKAGSEFVETTMEGTVRVVSSIFDSLLK